MAEGYVLSAEPRLNFQPDASFGDNGQALRALCLCVRRSFWHPHRLASVDTSELRRRSRNFCSDLTGVAPMKLLFVHPGPLLYTNVFLRLETLGLELVAEAARRRKHAVRLIDLQAESQAAYHRMIAEWLPDFIAFSCNYLANVPEIVDLAAATKIILPRCFICV